MPEPRVGVLGATSLVGDCLLPMLGNSGYEVFAFSRSAGPEHTENVTWLSAKSPGLPARTTATAENWVSLLPIWVLPHYLPVLEAHGARRVVALSSTGRFTKSSSSDTAEQELARRIARSEEQFTEWAEARGAAWIILRPTLIYGLGRDRNVCEIARFVRRFGFFPLLGKGDGPRQPIHARDVAQACVAALTSPVSGRAYEISGAEKMSYRQMVQRIFEAQGRPARFLPVPKVLFRLAIMMLRPLPRFRSWSIGMAERMDQDLSFGHAEAVRDLAFAPSEFRIRPEDLPR